MIDIHTHVIPFVDDGSKSLEDSISMIKHEIEIGVDTIIATPHHIFHRYECSVEEIKKNFNLLKEEIKKQNLKIELLLGQEIYYSSREDVISLLKEGKLLTLNNTNKVLLEFSFTREPEDLSANTNIFRFYYIHSNLFDWCCLLDGSLLHHPSLM